jgi:tetratricopeptide (TPR) repeat protein
MTSRREGGQLIKVEDSLRRAIAAYESGAWPVAEAACAELLRSDPNQPDALQILGNIRARSGDTQAAEPLFERARAVSPRNIFILNSLGGVYAANGRIAEAREALEAALRIDGSFPWALQNYGGLLLDVGDRAAAKRCFERALATDPRHVESIAALANLAEKENRLEDARALADRALALASNLLAARAVIARLELRAGHAGTAEAIAREMLAQPGLRANLRTTAHMLLGEALEKLGRFEEAFASFSEANEMDRKLQAPRLENAQYPSSPAAIEKLTAFMRTAEPSKWTRPPADGLPTPVFLVGFPRSGTTLLQQVLAGHPEITTLEEQDNFRDAHQSLLLAPGALERWSSLPEKELGQWRREYWNRVERKMRTDTKRATYLDKLPMNLAVLPVIHLLFPDAKFILALRDPRDVIVSCFRNHFAINAAMFQFLSLEGAARYYDAVMTSAEVARERLPLALHVVRYEDVVADLRGEAKKLMDFLGQPWTDDVLKYTETASRRAIFTPSATQVIQPIYQTSIGQWRRYEAQLAPVLPVLEPWVRKFGY